MIYLNIVHLVWKDNHSLFNQQSFTLNTERQQQNRQILTSQVITRNVLLNCVANTLQFEERKEIFLKQTKTNSYKYKKSKGGYIVWAELDIC